MSHWPIPGTRPPPPPPPGPQVPAWPLQAVGAPTRDTPLQPEAQPEAHQEVPATAPVTAKKETLDEATEGDDAHDPPCQADGYSGNIIAEEEEEEEEEESGDEVPELGHYLALFLSQNEEEQEDEPESKRAPIAIQAIVGVKKEEESSPGLSVVEVEEEEPAQAEPLRDLR